jgi:hypothetical protein
MIHNDVIAQPRLAHHHRILDCRRLRRVLLVKSLFGVRHVIRSHAIETATNGRAAERSNGCADQCARSRIARRIANGCTDSCPR